MRWTVEKKIVTGFGLMLAALIVVGVVSYRNTRQLLRDSNRVAHSHDILDELNGTLSTMKDAETGQRGFIITGDEQYLEPYNTSISRINRHLERLRELTAENPEQKRRLHNLELAVDAGFKLLSETIELRKNRGFVAAEGLITSGRDKRIMDDIRKIIGEMSDEENARLEIHRIASASSARNTTVTLSLLGALLLAFLPAGYLAIRRDILKRRRAEEALRESEERYKYLIEHAKEIIYRTDLDGNVIFVNPTAVDSLKFSEEELLGRHYLDLVKPEFRETAEKFYRRQLVRKIPNAYLEIPITTKDGAEIWIGQNTQLVMESGEVVGFQAIARDITERKRALEEWQSLSLTDDLTGLYNRRGFFTLTEQQLKHANRTHERFVLVFVDLDGLKQINDRFGHHEGSNAIRKAAEILRQTFRESDILARLGGDEFTVLALAASNENTDAIRARLQEKIRSFNASRNLPYDLGMSIGVALLDPRGELSIDEVIRRADAAMYEHKHRTKEKVSK
jgi:diguanylate cyclase (GGDEF)-like protein/PAS domain S-box-containing protein